MGIYFIKTIWLYLIIFLFGYKATGPDFYANGACRFFWVQLDCSMFQERVSPPLSPKIPLTQKFQRSTHLHCGIIPPGFTIAIVIQILTNNLVGLRLLLILLLAFIIFLITLNVTYMGLYKTKVLITNTQNLKSGFLFHRVLIQP